MTNIYTKNKELSSILGNFLSTNIEKMHAWLANNKMHIKYEEFKSKTNDYQPKEPDKTTNLKAWLKWKYKDNDTDDKWWWWENLRGDQVSIQVSFFETKYEEACDYLGIDYMNRVNEAHANGEKYLRN